MCVPPAFLCLADISGGMLELVSLAWSAWKLSRKRLGPYGAAAVTVLSVAGFVLLRNKLEEQYPGLAEGLEKAV